MKGVCILVTLLIAVWSAPIYAKGKWVSSGKTRVDGKRDVLFGPPDKSQKRGVLDVNKQGDKAHGHLVISKDGKKVDYLRTEKGVVITDKSKPVGEQHIAIKIIRPNAKP